MNNPIETLETPGRVALLGVAGSHAFGMATATSDVDYRGCYVVPTRELFRLTTPPEAWNHSNPDIAMHEVGRFLRLAAAANPTALETLHYSDYVIKSTIGDLLLEKRNLFITNKIRATHIGFAESQFAKITKRWNLRTSDEDKRVAKHARHTLRVIRLTERVLTTGVYSLVEPNPDEIFAFGELEHSEMVRKAAVEINRVRELDSVLPEGPDLDAVDALLVGIRETAL